MTRDRLDYTKHCFQQLETHAGTDYDHFVLDQASTDGTDLWLAEWKGANRHAVCVGQNMGISRGLNFLLDYIGTRYDVIVKFDNDCEPTSDGILRDVAQAAHDTGAIVSPVIHGLRNPVPTLSYRQLDGWPLRLTPMVGGIFMAVPYALYRTGFRYDETGPTWGGDDTGICAWHHGRGGLTGYLTTHQAWHYKTTDGQHDDLPAYFERRVLEGGPS